MNQSGSRAGSLTSGHSASGGAGMLRSAVTSITGRTLPRDRCRNVWVLPMLLPLVLLFIVVPIAELVVIIQVGQAIGVVVDDRAS